MIEQKQLWKNFHCIIKIESERYFKATGKIESETRFYLSSLQPDAELLNRSIRSHWRIENSLHWTLDVAFNEDNSRKRAGYAAQNFSVINRIALNLLINEKTSKRRVKRKRLKSGWDNEYLESILNF